MRLYMTTLLAASALALAACGSTTDECVDTCGQGSGIVPVDSTPCATGTVADFVENVGDRVFFDFDRSDVRPDGMATLQRQAAWLGQHSHFAVTINGHCDKRGSVEYNLALGERRGNAAMQQLVALGVNPARIKIVSYGKNQPVVEQDGSAWAFQQNRVAITVLD